MMRKKIKSKEEPLNTERLLDPGVIVKFGVETERLIPLLKEYLVPEEYRTRIDITLRSREEFQEAYGEYIFLRRFEEFLNKVSGGTNDFIYPCRCEVCGKIQNMVVENVNPETGERVLPNWRESIVCPECACSNHLRFLIGKIRKEYQEGMKVLLYEYGTTLYLYARHYIPDVTACECGGREREPIQEGDQIIYENPCEMGQPSGCFSLAIANDLWEKTEDAQAAWREAARVIKKGGKLIFTTVFNANSVDSAPGVFGWDILDKLKEAGFRDAYVKADFSIEEGYLGWLPMYFEAVK